MGFKDLKIWMKLALGFGLVVLIFVGFVAYEIKSLGTLGEKQHEGIYRAEDAIAIGEVDSRVEHFSALVGKAVILRDLEEAVADFEEFEAQAQKDMKKVGELSDTEAEEANAAEFSELYAKSLGIYGEELLPYLVAGGQDMAVIREMDRRIDNSRKKAMGNLDKVLNSLRQEMEEADVAFDTLHGNISRASMTAAGAGLIAAVLVAFLISLSISRPLKKAVNFAEAISEGDFERELDIKKRKDEIGVLADSMRNIPATLNSVVGEFNRLVAKINTGRLNERGDASSFKGDYARLIKGVNNVSETFVGYLDKIEMPIMAIDNDYNVLYMNEFGAKVGNTTPEKLRGGKCYDHFRTSDCRTENCACAQAMKSLNTAHSETDAHPGDLDLEIKYTANPIYDDDGRVVGAIEIVIDQTDIVQAQRRMVSLAERADSISQRLSSASEELAAQVEQVTRGAENQRDRIGETATAMDQMNATVMEVAKNASSASESSGNASSEADQGAEIVSEAVEAISAVHASAAEMQDNMKDLGNQAESIGEIMNVITDIADQTNLLALNAAIEAARAGDAGRGFAVVADEVRKLAEKTMSATNEVGSSIRAIQEAAQNNIASMDRAAETVERATGLANRSGDALRKIVDLVGENANMVDGIATAAEEQSAASEQINRSIEEVNRIVSETTDGMHQSSQALQELATMSSDLAELIAELQSGNGKKETGKEKDRNLKIVEREESGSYEEYRKSA
jgi:methyl-accepting chemotaxis protein